MSERQTFTRIGFFVIGLAGLLALGSLRSVHGAHAAAGDVVINELQYHPLSDDHGEEYIELFNTGTAAVDLSGWTFSDGIHYTFPAGTVLGPGEYVVVGHNPATVEAVYTITGVLGPFESGRLANEGERVALDDALGTTIDEVTYDDHAPWSERADGDGPSLELINPAFDNDRPCSWGASAGLGTPGAQNSVYVAGNIPPCITDVAHAPVFPTSDQAVTVTAHVDDNSAVAGVTLNYRPEGTVDYTALPMTHSGGGVYSGAIPAQAAGTYVEFTVTATDDEAAARTAPDGAPSYTSTETGAPVTVSYLFLVEDVPPSDDLPIYRLLMTAENQAELLARDPFSNVLLDATFVDGDSGESFYNVGVRYRGESSRTMTPRPYRVKFSDAQEFAGRERLNLINDAMAREALAYDLFQRAGLPASDTRFVTLYLNDGLEGHYLDVENVDNEFLRAHFAGEDRPTGGNLYRGYSEGEQGADLRYLGPAPDPYRPYYLKKNNEDADDFTDIMALTGAISNTADADFCTATEAVADMRQWVRWFAVQAVLDNHEGALWIGYGDDYFLYHRPSDGRFILIPWDHDFTFLYADHSIWEPNWLGPPLVRRILNAPDFARWYYQDVADLAMGAFSVASMHPRIDALPDVIDGAEKTTLKQYVTERVPALLAQIPTTTLAITTHGGVNFSTTQLQVTLEGTCSPLRDVAVNGSATGVHYPSATTWAVDTALEPGDNVFVAGDGVHTDTLTVKLASFHGGTLTEDLTLTTDSSPYAINEDIIVPAGVTLTIEPGVTLLFESNRALRVENGRLLAEGTASQPIVLTKRWSGYWGGILLMTSQEDNRIVHAVIEYTREAITNPRTHGVTTYGSRVTIADSIIRHTDASVAIQTYPWGAQTSSLTLLRTEIYDIEGDAIHATEGSVYIQGNHIHDIYHGVYALEGIQLSDILPGADAQLLDNYIHHISDDCMDLNESSATIARNRLHHCGDKGLSIGHPSTTTVVNNLIYACQGKDSDQYSGSAIAVKDGAISTLMNNTLADSRHGIYVYEGHAGEGGGVVTVINTIVWGNTTTVTLDALSTITITYSAIEGGWPGEGNIATDPLFHAPASGVYRLREGSPCIDSGTPTGAPAEDVFGIARPHGEGVDMGAHEFFAFFSVYLPLVMRAY